MNLHIHENLDLIMYNSFMAVSLTPPSYINADYPFDYIDIASTSNEDKPLLSYISNSRLDFLLSDTNPYNAINYRVSLSPGKFINKLASFYTCTVEPWQVQKISEYIINQLYPYRGYTLPQGYSAYILHDELSFITAYTHDSSGYFPIYSCMVNKPDFIEIYYDNPNLFNIGVLLDNNGVIVSRCLIHPTINCYDRVYGGYEERDIMEKWLQSKGMKAIYENESSQFCYDIDMSKYSKIPYLDSFRYGDDSHLYNYNANNTLDLQTQTGYNPYASVKTRCECCNRILTDDNEIIDIDGSNYCNECCVYSEYTSRYYLSEDCIYSEWDNSYILADDSQWLYNNLYCHNSNAIRLYNRDYAHESDDNLMQSIDGDYFIVRN